jgi:hypothetical protein
VADGDRIAVEWRVVVEEDGAEVAFAGTSLLRFRGHRAMRLFMRACESGSGAGQGEEARTSDRALGNTAPARNSGCSACGVQKLRFARKSGFLASRTEF